MTLFHQYPFLIPLVALFLAETFKVIIASFRKKKLQIVNFLHSGGMPSGHSALVSSLTTLAYLKFGVSSIEFAITVVLAIIVLYDAVNLRGEAGKHAKVLNQLQNTLSLEERLGHTYPQMVAGVILGGSVAWFLY